LCDPQPVDASMYRDVFDHSSSGIFVSGVDGDGGLCVVDANPAFERLTGLSIAYARGRRLDEVVPAAPRERVMAAHRECLRSAARREFHGRWRTPQGLRSLHITLTPVIDPAGRIRRIVGVACDVTAEVATTHRMSVFEAALDQVREAVYLIDEHGRPQYVNDEACRMLGYDHATLRGLAVWDVDPQWNARRWFRKWAELKALGRRKFETLHRTKEGRLIPVEVMASHVAYQSCDYDLVLVRDITERKRAEQEFRALVEHSPDIVVRYDRECRRVYANPALAHAIGLAEVALLGRRPAEEVAATPEVASRYEATVRTVLATGRDAVFDVRWHNARNDLVTTQVRLIAERDTRGEVVSVLGIGRDISSLMQTQRQLSTLIEGLPDVVARCDREGRIVYLSPAGTRLLAPLLSEYSGKTMAELSPQYGPPVLDSIRRVTETGLPHLFELPFPVQGELRHWEVRHVPEVGEHGRVTGVLGIARDITERRQAEQTIRELHQRNEAAREEERRHIARELHDELGQYLLAMRLEASLLRMRWGGTDPALREKAESLQTTVDHVIQVVRSLVTSLRPPVLDIGIASALEWLIEEFRGPSGMDCRLHLDESSIALDAQQTVMVFRIVQESLTNVTRHAQASRVDVTLERRGSNFMLLVSDDGRGFDPTFQPHRSLGLVGVRERAQMLSGQLDIRSSPGAGTTISVAFPTRPTD